MRRKRPCLGRLDLLTGLGEEPLGILVAGRRPGPATMCAARPATGSAARSGGPGGAGCTRAADAAADDTVLDTLV
jgi:hypothetical protein